MRRVVVILSALALASLAALGCGGGGPSHTIGGGTSRNFQVLATDAPFPATLTCLVAATVDIDRIELERAGPIGGLATVEVPILPQGTTVSLLQKSSLTAGTTNGGTTAATATLNLLGLRAGIAETIVEAAIPTGTYQAIHLHILRAVVSFRDGAQQVFTVPATFSGVVPTRTAGPDGNVTLVPERVIVVGSSTGPTTATGTAAAGVARILLDFDLAQSFTILGGITPTCSDLRAGMPLVTFNPVIRVRDLDFAGVVEGTVREVTGARATALGDVAIIAVMTGLVPSFNGNNLLDTNSGVTLSSDGTLPAAPLGRFALVLDPGTYDIFVLPQGAIVPRLAASHVVVTPGAPSALDLVIRAGATR